MFPFPEVEFEVLLEAWERFLDALLSHLEEIKADSYPRDPIIAVVGG